MAKKIREQAISLESYLESVNSEDVSENQDVQRMFCWDNAAINELIYTVLNEDYMPPIILGEEELGFGCVQQYIVDGNQRTMALNMFKNMNWKTTKTFEESIVQYQVKRRDETGHILKDENGSVLWDQMEFDVKNKTYEQLPDELKKKFDNYQVRIVIHQNCTMQQISKLVRRYNRNKSMSSNQKALTWIPTYARKIKTITENDFYKECITCSSALRKNGSYEQTVADSVMTVFHIENWKKTPKDRNDFLDANAKLDEFETIDQYGKRIATVCEDKFANLFVNKDIPSWFAVFDKFTKAKLPDVIFANFLTEVVSKLHSKIINGDSYDLLYKEVGTSDKKLVQRKINLYIALMKDYLHIEDIEETENTYEETTDKEITESENNTVEETTENNVTTEETESVVTESQSEEDHELQFVKKVADPNVEQEDIELYKDFIDDYLKLDSCVYKVGMPVLLALMAYACNAEKDEEFSEWLNEMEKQHRIFTGSEKDNYEKLKAEFLQFLNSHNNKAA